MNRHLRLFGPPVLVDGDGQPLSFRTKKQLALLVYLVLETRQRPAPRDLLLEFFWPAVEPQRGRHSLSQALTSIRARLGPDAVTRDRHTVQLLRAVTTDLDGLDRADPGSVAVERPLEELDRAGSPDFGHWVDGVRQRCLREVRGVLARQMVEARTRGDVNRVYERAAQLYRVDPLSSAAIHALAEQLLQESDTAGTCRLIRSYCARFESEVGGQPPPDLLRLLRRIEAGTIRPPSGLPVEATRRLARAEVFVGREAELARLEALWNEASRGELVTCLVAGPVGIGKSSLLRRFAMSVSARGGTALEVACQEIGRTIPFAAVSDLIQVLSRDPAVSGTDPRWLAEASRVSPGLRAAYPGIPEAPPVPAESVRIRIGEAILRMSRAATEEHPVLLVIDDIGNLDPASRDVLHVLLHRAQKLPLLVVASAPTTATRSLTSSPSEGAALLPWSEAVALPLLAPNMMRLAIEEMANGESDIPLEIIDELTELSAGNPYIAEMLLSDWIRNGVQSLAGARLRGQRAPDAWSPPEMIRKAFERQYQGLDSMSEQIVNLLAVSKRELSLMEIRTLLGHSFAITAKFALQLVERGIIRVCDHGLSFKNQLHREFIYGNMSRETRWFYHSQIGMQWSARVAPGNFRYGLEGAYHLQTAGMAADAARCLARGAREAIQRGAPREAELAITQFFTSTPQPTSTELRILLAEAALAQGKHTDALQTLDRVDGHCSTSEQVTRSLVLRAEALQRGGLTDLGQAAAVARDALRAAERLQDEEQILRSLLVSAEVASGDADWNVIESIQTTAAAMAERASDSHIRASATVADAFCLMALGRPREAAHSFSRAAAHFRADSRDTELRRALNGLGMCQTSIGEWSGAITSFEEAVALASQIGDLHGERILWDNLAVLFEDLGCFEEAVSARRRAFQISRAVPMPARDIMLLANASSLAVTIGSFPEASDFLAEALELAQHTQIQSLNVTVLVAMANLDIAKGTYSSAWAWAEEAIATARKHSINPPTVADFERVRRHFLWATRGYDAMVQTIEKGEQSHAALRESQHLELAAFSDWIELQEHRAPSGSAAAQRLIERGIYGAVAHLVAVNTYPGNLPPRKNGESSAQLVIRSFPACQQRSVPKVVDAPPGVAGSPCSDEMPRQPSGQTEHRTSLQVPTASLHN
ncbi:MAG: AAA family ATPase [Gemmatimonadota bacterium]|nr:AAA family ATPase [Gemmatimonadota bacterium]